MFRYRKGATLVEAIVATVIMATLSVGFINMIGGTLQAQAVFRDGLQYQTYAMSKWNELAPVSYASITAQAPTQISGLNYDVEVAVDPPVDHGGGVYTKTVYINIYKHGSTNILYGLQQVKSNTSSVPAHTHPGSDITSKVASATLSDTATTATTATSAGYATSAGNADTLDGYHANQLGVPSGYMISFWWNPGDGAKGCPTGFTLPGSGAYVPVGAARVYFCVRN